MKCKSFILASSLVLSGCLMATSITFNVSESFVFDGSTAITKANSSSYTALGVFGDISGLDFSSAASLATGLSGFPTDTLSAVPLALPIPLVWSESVDSGSAGNIGSLVIFSGNDLATASSFGVVTNTTFTTLGFGSEAINFTGTTHTWDTALAGTLTGSSFTLTSGVVPEQIGRAHV